MHPVRLVVALFMPLLQAERASALVGIEGKDGIVARDGARDGATAGTSAGTAGAGGAAAAAAAAASAGLSRGAASSRCGGLVTTASGALVAVTASDVLRSVAALASSREWLAALVACAARTEEAEEMAGLATIKVRRAPCMPRAACRMRAGVACYTFRVRRAPRSMPHAS